MRNQLFPGAGKNFSGEDLSFSKSHLGQAKLFKNSD